jgi:hypothetical protein
MSPVCERVYVKRKRKRGGRCHRVHRRVRRGRRHAALREAVSQYQELIDLELLKMGGWLAAEMTLQLFASGVKMPVLMIQVLEDEWTRNPEDAQKTFDLLASKEKELFWIKNTKKRFRDGYNYFGRHPETIISFFDMHMK